MREHASDLAVPTGIAAAASLPAGADTAQRPCYWASGLHFLIPPSAGVVPCVDSGESACCMLGDVCLAGNACWNVDNGFVYQYGCTDISYQDKTCPFKCGWNPLLSPWIALENCSDDNVDAWVCKSPESCGCDWEAWISGFSVPSRKCRAMGSLARVALYATDILPAYVSLPNSYGGSTGYFDASITAQTPVPGYTPSTVTQPSLQTPPPTDIVILFPNATPSLNEGSFQPITAPGPTSTFTLTGHLSKETQNLVYPSIQQPSASQAEKIGGGVGIASGFLALGLFYFVMLAVRQHRSRKNAQKQRPAFSSRSGLLRSHWRALASMLGALFVGLAFALGHHGFYHNLAGKSVEESSINILGTHISSQQMNIAVGTAFAFLVKAFLVFAVSVAYTQALWTTAKSQRKSKPLEIASLDSLFSVLNDFLAFLRLPLWFRHPLLLCLAGTAWLIPLAAIVTPATLSVQFAPLVPSPSKMMYVPNLDLRSLSFSATLFKSPMAAPDNHYKYSGPSVAVQRVAGASALEGAILSVNAPNSNSTWNVNFQGPSLRCRNLEAPLRNSILKDIANLSRTAPGCYVPPAYLSWYASDTKSDIPDTSNNNSLDASLFVALMPSLLQPYSEAQYSLPACQFGDAYSDFLSSTVIRCDMVESRYDVDFTVINGEQSVNATISSNGGPLQNVSSIAVLDSGALRSVTYQSILNAYMAWVLGTISNGVLEETALLVQTQIMSTILMRAQEMNFLLPQEADSDLRFQYQQNLQSVLEQHGRDYAGLSPTLTQSSKQSLASMLEELFVNTTISLMSAPELQPNHTSISAPSKVKVTLLTYHNIYFYSAFKLWIAYGSAVACTVLAIAVGIFSMYINQASYSNCFSTILRAARGAEPSVVIKDKDTSGVDPLPKYIAKATLTFNDTVSRADDDEPDAEGETVEPKKPSTSTNNNRADVVSHSNSTGEHKRGFVPVHRSTV